MYMCSLVCVCVCVCVCFGGRMYMYVLPMCVGGGVYCMFSPGIGIPPHLC